MYGFPDADTVPRRARTRCVPWLLVLAAVAGACAVASAVPMPRFEATSIAILDREHAVLAREDVACPRQSGCPARILVSADGGRSWRLTTRTTGPVRLSAVRGTREVWAGTGTDVLESRDAGMSWRRVLRFPAAAIAFADQRNGWLLPAGVRVDRPRPLLATASGGADWRQISGPCRRPWATVALARPTARQGWVACTTEAAAGTQGKEIWSTSDAGATWRLRALTGFPGLPGATGQRNRGDIPAFGYVTGIAFLADGRGWLWEDRGWLLMTRDGGTHWRRSRITRPDQIAARSASLLSSRVGYVLLAGCRVRLVRTADGGAGWTTVDRWSAPGRC